MSFIQLKSNSATLTGYSDSDHAGDIGDRKSTSGFIFIINGCTISWPSMKQKTVLISNSKPVLLNTILNEFQVNTNKITKICQTCGL